MILKFLGLYEHSRTGRKFWGSGSVAKSRQKEAELCGHFLFEHVASQWKTPITVHWAIESWKEIYIVPRQCFSQVLLPDRCCIARQKCQPHYLHSLNTNQNGAIPTLFNAYRNSCITRVFGRWQLVGMVPFGGFPRLK